jgi:hypothetical protein
LADRTAYFVFDSQRSRDFDMKAGVPQKSLLSPVLFLLSITTLYEDLQAVYQQLIRIEFTDNTNLLAVGSTFENIRNLLEAAWGICERWSQKTGVWLNNRLSWKTHLAKIKGKIATQMLAFSKLAASA